MQIEITNQFIQQVARKVAAAATEIIRESVLAEEESELEVEAIASNADAKSRILVYLKATKLGVHFNGDRRSVGITNEDLRRKLCIPVNDMTRAREALEREGHLVTIERSHMPMYLWYTEIAPAPEPV